MKSRNHISSQINESGCSQFHINCLHPLEIANDIRILGHSYNEYRDHADTGRLLIRCISGNRKEIPFHIPFHHRTIWEHSCSLEASGCRTKSALVERQDWPREDFQEPGKSCEISHTQAIEATKLCGTIRMPSHRLYRESSSTQKQGEYVTVARIESGSSLLSNCDVHQFSTLLDVSVRKPLKQWKGGVWRCNQRNGFGKFDDLICMAEYLWSISQKVCVEWFCAFRKSDSWMRIPVAVGFIAILIRSW
jgi:hypothetical protein